ncbi:MAG: helix-turn-helix transcriptional regulator [Treponema sp.]|jgi:DNA-binding HxlR family transcriptional regulator|nr:helix-turn-helix transcriptional regulator [Treponema sp.]
MQYTGCKAGTFLLYRHKFVTIGGTVMLTKDELPVCPVATTVSLIGNKWKLLILRNLLAGTCRFGELRKGIPGISQKVLTDNLREMESDGLLNRTVFAEVPPRVEYSLSDLGNSMRPIIKDMEAWGKKYREMVLNDQTQ